MCSGRLFVYNTLANWRAASSFSDCEANLWWSKVSLLFVSVMDLIVWDVIFCFELHLLPIALPWLIKVQITGKWSKDHQKGYVYFWLQTCSGRVARFHSSLHSCLIFPSHIYVSSSALPVTIFSCHSLINFPFYHHLAFCLINCSWQLRKNQRKIKFWRKRTQVMLNFYLLFIFGDFLTDCRQVN